MSEDVLFEVDGDLAIVTLNRPRAINALTLEMCQKMLGQLELWSRDDSVRALVLRGAGERGFCAGADVRALREQLLTQPARAKLFLATEYTLNAMLASYPKPITSIMTGITMGGGMGLSVHSRGERVADPSTRIAMPETNIGLWPDVGVAYELSRAPGQSGVYLAMTGDSIDAASAKYAGLVDTAPGDPELSQLALDRVWIDECFNSDDGVEILDRLRDHDNERARAAAAVIAQKSPWSVRIALAAVRRAERMADVAEVLEQDRVLAEYFTNDSDFIEGVRAQLVDKDRNPKWRHGSLAEVPDELVSAAFEPNPE